MVLNSDTDCIGFKGYHDENGYVHFQFRLNKQKKNVYAHRASYVIHNNEEILSEDVIMHTCDNPSCVNPLHLVKGTHIDNVIDRVQKNRSAIGSKNGRFKHGIYTKEQKDYRKSNPKPKSPPSNRLLKSEEKIKEVKLAIKNRKCSLKELSDKLSLPYQLIRDINCGRIYC